LVARYGAGLLSWAAARLGRGSRAKKNRVDLRFVPDDHATYSSVGTFIKEHEHAMSFWGEFNVTNVTSQNVFLLKFRFHGLNTGRHMLLGDSADDAGVPIFRRHICTVKIHCLLRSLRAREPFIVDIIFTDNFGDEHRVRSVRFDFRGP
jgi:hypothetical protein